MIDHEQRILELEDKVNDLLWRMNAVCNVLHEYLGQHIEGSTDALYMKEEIKP